MGTKSYLHPVTNPVGNCQALVKPATGNGSMVHILAVSSTISESAALPQGTGVAVCRLRRTLSWVNREMKDLSTHSP